VSIFGRHWKLGHDLILGTLMAAGVSPENLTWFSGLAGVVMVMVLMALAWRRWGAPAAAVASTFAGAVPLGIIYGHRIVAEAAGLAGVALSQIDNVSPNLGQGYIIDSFMVVVFGGVGNLFGTLVGATALGIVNKFLEPYAGAVLGKILVLVFIILFIQRRPRGLFALKGRSVE